MSKLIDKDALVSEIERRNKILVDMMNRLYYASNYNEWEAVVKEYRSLMSFINTIEVKEVDLYEEIEKCLKKHSMLAVGKKDFTDIAKYFFELGLKVVQNNS